MIAQEYYSSLIIFASGGSAVFDLYYFNETTIIRILFYTCIATFALYSSLIGTLPTQL